MKRILLFGGTTEGREITEKLLEDKDVHITVCTATSYGKELLPEENDNLKILVSRLNSDEMYNIIISEKIDEVIDATHPYAVIVSENIRMACERAGALFTRIERPSELNDIEDAVVVSSVKEAAEYLNKTDGNILSTIGSKELALLTSIADYKDRVYARILPLPEMVKKACELGFEGNHLICMQGPFSRDMNLAMLKEYDIKYLLTKESGANGGFKEKCESAFDSNATLVIVKRPK